MNDLNKELITAADAISMLCKCEMPEHARKAINYTVEFALRNPKVWEFFKAFVDANISGELKQVERH